MEELSLDRDLDVVGHIILVTYLIRTRFSEVSRLVHISKSEKKAFLDLLGYDSSDSSPDWPSAPGTGPSITRSSSSATGTTGSSTFEGYCSEW